MNEMNCGVKLYQPNRGIIKICYNGPGKATDFTPLEIGCLRQPTDTFGVLSLTGCINKEVHYGTIIGAEVND